DDRLSSVLSTRTRNSTLSAAARPDFMLGSPSSRSSRAWSPVIIHPSKTVSETRMNVRRIVSVLTALTAIFVCVPGFAQDWPDHPIRFIVPFTAGGANDLMGRAAADGVSKKLGKPVIVENKPGAGTVVGAEYVAKAKPDGYTFLVGAAGIVTNSALM